MSNILCGLCPFLFGAALAWLVFWLIARRPAAAKPPNSDPELPFDLLWFSPACRAALGDRCSRPGRLRKMRKECIAKFLKNAHFPPHEIPPDETQYSTWPMQADLICQGKFASLREWQSAELVKRAVGAEEPTAEHKSRTRRSPDDMFLLLVFIGLLIAATLCGYMASTHHWCGTCVAHPCPPPPICSTCPDSTRDIELTVSSDVLFDFKEAKIQGDARRKRAIELLSNAFKDFERVNFYGVSAHTDPIGTISSNKNLAYKRAQDILSLLDLVNKDPARKTPLTDQKLDENLIDSRLGLGADADTEDRQIWRECFSEYYLGKEKPISAFDKPLLDLPPDSLTTDQLSCSKASIDTGANDPYPGCARPQGPIGNARHTYEVGERFRQIVECLAPMRHVLIKFRVLSFKPNKSAPNSTTTPKG